MSDIPEARRIIEDVAQTIKAYGYHPEVRQLQKALDLMHRRPMAKPRAPVTSAAIGPEEAAAIRAIAARRPELSEQEIAEMFKTNAGRVSEALHRDR